jgi:hypothetical protein
MSPEFSTTKSDFVSLSAASSLVPYSREYISRLAREGKIFSVQQDKACSVSRVSLLSFYENSQIEESVKKRVLSTSRKNDLEVRQNYKKQIADNQSRVTSGHLASLFMSVCIVSAGLFSGMGLYEVSKNLNHSSNGSTATVVNSTLINGRTAERDLSTKTVLNKNVVSETYESIPIGNGIVLFPNLSASNTAAVASFFSDDVSVEMTGTTTGVIWSDTATLPFVRVPEKVSTFENKTP